MQSFSSLTRMFGVITSACFIVLGIYAFSANAQQSMSMPTPTPAMTDQSQKPQTDAVQMSDDEVEIAHPFFTHMGMPERVGVFSLRLSGLVNRVDGRTKGDFAFHFETGLTKRIGIHIRNDSFLNRTRSEVMIQFAAIRSKDGMSGFSPIIEFEIPTRRGGGSRVNTLVGFSTALVKKRAAFNQVIHYSPREDAVDYSAALVLRVGKRYFPVFEILGEAMRGDRPIVNLLGGFKVRVNKNLTLGFAVQAPVTSRKDFTSQLVGQSDLEWRRKQ